MKTIEMKQKNEEILARWRELGFLNGLKTGSINEWRCAKSYDDMANYLLSNNNDYSTTLAFPFIRRVLCTRKKRLYRIIKPSEVIDFLNTTTVEDCLYFLSNSEIQETQNITKPKSVKEMKKIILLKIFSHEKFKDEKLSVFFTKLSVEKDYYKFLKQIIGSVIDIEAELLVIACDLFVEKNT